MIYQLNEEEYLLLQKSFSNYAERLSPIAKINMSALLISIQKDKIIKNIDQINTLIVFLQVISKAENKEHASASNKHSEYKRGIDNLREEEQIYLFLENLRLFRWCNILSVNS